MIVKGEKVYKKKSITLCLSPESYESVLQAGLLARSISGAFPSMIDSGRDCPKI